MSGRWSKQPGTPTDPSHSSLEPETSISHNLKAQLRIFTCTNLIDVTVVCEGANSKLVNVVTVADIDAQKHVDYIQYII